VGRPKLRTEQLRDRLLEEALRLLEVEGPTAIRARTVSDAAGSSTASLYELFGDKSGLVRALFYESFALLDERQRALAPTGDPYDDLVALLGVTRAFARDRPMLFDLMFGRPFEEFDPTTADSEVARAIYRRSVRAVATWLASIDSAMAPKLAAEILVATHRGLIGAELSGILGRTAASRDQKYRTGVEVVLAGLAASPGAAAAGGGG
jgi:AcrR family transcriptional regulator